MAEPTNAGADFVAAWLTSLPAHNELVARTGNRNIETPNRILRAARRERRGGEVVEGGEDGGEEGRKGPHDEIGRDAEYYLKSRWQVAMQQSATAKFIYAFGGGGLNVIYNGLKATAIGLNFEPVMR